MTNKRAVSDVVTITDREENPKKLKHDIVIPSKAKLSGIQFGLFTTEEIERLSVVSVSNSNINQQGVVCQKGINDSSMGTSNRSMLCSTCACELEYCPGHMGHLKFNIPVINIEFISHIYRILNCVCFNCSKLLTPTNNWKFLRIKLIKKKKKRQLELYNYCQKFMVCKNESGCGSPQPKYKKEDITITALFTEPSWGDFTNSKPLFDTKKLVQILQHISDSDMILLGMDPKNSPPVGMIWQNFIIPPISMRPTKFYNMGNKISNEDDVTIRLKSIIKAHKKLDEYNISGSQVSLSMYKLRNGHVATDIEVTENGWKPQVVNENITNLRLLYNKLSRCVAAYQDSRYHCSTLSDISDWGKDKKGIRDRFTGKQAKKGRIRNTITGKRQNYSARTVITPSNRIRVNEVGVPICICMKLLYPEKVCDYNIHKLTELVRNGPDKYPGVLYVTDNDKKQICVKSIDRYMLKLRVGFIVHRHLMKGDYVLMNRQPSLHKMSLMAHKVQPVSGKSFQIHMAVTKPYNADFDGDEMNLQVVMDDYTRAEAMVLLNVNNNMVKDGRMIVSFQQHAVAAVYILSKETTCISMENAFQLWFQYPGLMENSCIPDYKTNKMGTKYYTGRDIISLCLPHDMNIHNKDIHIENGKLRSGRVTGYCLNQQILYIIWKDYGKEYAMEFLYGFHLLLDYYISTIGLSIGMDDCQPVKSDDLVQITQKAKDYVDKFTDHTPEHIGKYSEVIENNNCTILDKLRDIIGDRTLLYKSRLNNGLYDIVKSGAKGNDTNIIQIAGIVGQQRNDDSIRIPIPTNHFDKTKRSEAHGMIYRSFFSGLKPVEYFHHLIGSRSGLVDTAVKTSETGYSQRRIVKGMEDITVHMDYTVRSVTKQIVQFVYAQDGIDTAFIEKNKVSLLDQKVLSAHTIDQCFSYLPEHLQIRIKKEHNDFCEVYTLHLNDVNLQVQRLKNIIMDESQMEFAHSPVNFNRLIKRSKTRFIEQVPDLSPLDIYKTIESLWKSICKEFYCHSTEKTKYIFHRFCNVENIWGSNRIHRSNQLQWFVDKVQEILRLSLITPFESIGVIASQNCAEPLTYVSFFFYYLCFFFCYNI